MTSLKQFKLPDVGEGLTEADIVKWHVQPGDKVTVNQTIVEIETAKAMVELPCPFDGVVAGLLVSEGETVDVGTPIISVDVSGGAGQPDGPEAGPGRLPQAAPGGPGSATSGDAGAGVQRDIGVPTGSGVTRGGRDARRRVRRRARRRRARADRHGARGWRSAARVGPRAHTLTAGRGCGRAGPARQPSATASAAACACRVRDQAGQHDAQAAQGKGNHLRPRRATAGRINLASTYTSSAGSSRGRTSRCQLLSGHGSRAAGQGGGSREAPGPEAGQGTRG